jgi:hypothetical protein
MKLQKHYLEVSSSSRNEVRAFFRFIAEGKNCEFFQMSQKKRLEILRCVGVLNFFFFYTKHSFWGPKNSVTLQPGTILNSSRPGTLCPAVVMIVPPMPVCPAVVMIVPPMPVCRL